MALCNARQRRCKGCDHRYTAQETESGITHCPDCQRQRGHCGAQAVTGSTKCRHHGGKSLKGIAHPNFSTGAALLKALPKRTREDFLGLFNDTEYLDLKSQMAAVFAILTDTLKQIDSGASGDKWRELQKAIRLYRKANTTEERASRFDEIERIAMDGVVDFNARVTVLKTVEQYRKLHDSIIKKQTASSGMFTGEQVLSLLMTLMLGVKRIVQDRKQLADIADLYDTIVAQASGTTVEGRERDTDDNDLSGAIQTEVVSSDPGLQRQEA